MWVADWARPARAAGRRLRPVGLRARRRSIRRAARAARDAATRALGLGHDPRRRGPASRTGVDYLLHDPRRVREHRDRGEFLEWAEVQRPLLRDPRRARSASALAAGNSCSWRSRSRGRCRSARRCPAPFFVFVQHPDVSDPRAAAAGAGGPRTRRRSSGGSANARRELAEAHWYDVQLINDDLDRSVDELAAILVQNHCGG